MKFIVLVLMLISGAMMSPVSAQEGQYAPLNGLELYYEIHGEGEPLVLLHGGLGGIPEFGALLPALAQTRQVIAVELQGHGHTADIDRPLSYEALADDIAALIAYLELEQADVMGFSLGGGVALQTAIRHPEVVRKLVLVSTPFRREGIHEVFRQGMSAMTAESASAMLETPMYMLYSSVAPNLDDWATLVGKVGAMMAQDYDWSADVTAMTTPTLILAGDSDMIPPAHAVEMFGLLGGGVPGDFGPMPASQVAILPATTHFTILSKVEMVTPLVNAFLDAPAAQS